MQSFTYLRADGERERERDIYISYVHVKILFDTYYEQTRFSLIPKYNVYKVILSIAESLVILSRNY